MTDFCVGFTFDIYQKQTHGTNTNPGGTQLNEKQLAISFECTEKYVIAAMNGEKD